jgi:hypothetical protein
LVFAEAGPRPERDNAKVKIARIRVFIFMTLPPCRLSVAPALQMAARVPGLPDCAGEYISEAQLVVILLEGSK